ncbi:MAG: hypothetical protein HYR93_10560 [Chloroflexi bacterium]|nr:hypothetical protein [Chloroflexota bacterium]
MQGESTRVTILVAQTLEALGIPYAVGGSLASSLHGVMRSTLDVDIVADMRVEHIQPLVTALSKEFYTDDEMRRLSVISTDPEQSVYVASPEDVILSKLEWYRMGGEISDRQWRDILGVLKTRSGQLDLAYMRKWAKELTVEILLERALNET